MRLPALAKKKARIEIIPMIDTMFFLLVFFMIATLSMTLQRGLSVTLPTAESATEKIPEQVSITVTKDGLVHFNKEPLGLQELEHRLQNFSQIETPPAITLNADEQVSHGRVISIMDLIRKAGISSVSIATKPSK